MKIIFSRKGFDSSYGGIPSPIFPDARMASLPIPSDAGLPAKQCRAGEFPMTDLLRGLSTGKFGANTLLHLDPDLEVGSISRLDGWTPAFGQVGAAQSHLSNQSIDVGDLFLFFGWYRQVEFNDSCWKYVATSKDFHSLFGWLQVGKVLAVDELKAHEVPEWLKDHPHIQHRDRFVNQQNTIYLASSHLSVGGSVSSHLGAGTFKRWSPELKLTAEGHTRSVWKVPHWLQPVHGKPALTYHGNPERWRRVGNELQLKSVAKGQEFVFDTSHYPESLDWAKALIERHV